jgi:hypothetical protein
MGARAKRHGEQGAHDEPLYTADDAAGPWRSVAVRGGRFSPTRTWVGRCAHPIDGSKVQPGRREPDAALRHFTPAGEQCIAIKSKLDCHADLIRPGQCL